MPRCQGLQSLADN